MSPSQTQIPAPADPARRAPVSDVQAAVTAGIEIAGPATLAGAGRFYTQLVPAGAHLEHIDVEALAEPLLDRPRRKHGTVHVQDSPSFLTYLEKHGIPETEIWADPARLGLVGVINAHTSDAAGHGDHRVLLELLPTDAWKAWTGHDKEWMGQQAFAEHLEDNAADIVVPDAATMLEIAESFQATMSGNFKRATRLHSGVVSLAYEETHAARAGHSGDLEIPTEFTLAVRPFEGSELCELTARFRYRIREGHLSLSFALRNPGDVIRDAFSDHVHHVRDNVDWPVLMGRPA